MLKNKKKFILIFVQIFRIDQNGNVCLTIPGSRPNFGHRLLRYIVDRESQALSYGTLLDPIGPTCQKLQPSKVSLFWPSENTMFFLPNGIVAVWYMLPSKLNIHLIAFWKLYKTHTSNKKSHDHSKSYWPKTNFGVKSLTKSCRQTVFSHRLSLLACNHVKQGLSNGIFNSYICNVCSAHETDGQTFYRLIYRDIKT